MAEYFSEAPKFDNFQANEDYLRSFTTDAVVFYHCEQSGVSLPFMKLAIPGTNRFDLVSPINFPPQLAINNESAFLVSLRSAAKELGAVCLYFQTKNNLSPFQSHVCDTHAFRTNFYFDLNQSEQDLMTSMKRDAKSRLKKLLNVPDSKVAAKTPGRDFFDSYSQLAKDKQFSTDYFYKADAIIDLTKQNKATYLEISRDNEFCAGGVFGHANTEVDYLFGATRKQGDDSIRYLLYCAFQYFKQLRYTRLYLGGGISENDSLSIYKQRQGAMAHRCSVVRLVLDEALVEKLSGQALTSSFYDGFFPPYRRP